MKMYGRIEPSHGDKFSEDVEISVPEGGVELLHDGEPLGNVPYSEISLDVRRGLLFVTVNIPDDMAEKISGAMARMVRRPA